MSRRPNEFVSLIYLLLKCTSYVVLSTQNKYQWLNTVIIYMYSVAGFCRWCYCDQETSPSFETYLFLKIAFTVLVLSLFN